MSAHSPKSNWGSPPHTRGIRVIKELRPTWVGITPAHAGNTCCSALPLAQGWDHPRTRGEYIDMYKVALEVVGSPPHTRGILVAQRYRWRRDGITPAHAGNTSSICKRPSTPWDHPRTRGEYCVNAIVEIIKAGSPPHTRGIRTAPRRSDRSNTDHPRTRGEYQSGHRNIS